MQLLSFILIYPIIWVISILPMKILYVLSDIIYIPIYYFFGYRKKVVRNNLNLAFPEKSAKELLHIEKRFYHHFVDIFMEIIKSFTISNNEISKRMVLKNPEALDDFRKNNQSIILMAGHYANWEWVSCLNKTMKYDGYPVYKKIKNKYFDKKIRSSRNRFGTNFVATSDLLDLIQEHADNNKMAMYGLLSDQSPKLSKTHYWSKFMGVEVPIQTGSEMLAKKFNYPVIYLQTERVKRGYYESTIKILAEKPKEFKDYQITELFLRELELQLRKKPRFYFWTHKRFKHAR
jgi:Kdo2-lipid IVA lauroyltransferase/acyltransferase